MQEPDPVAIRAAINGDHAAFESLIREYQAPVWRFLRHLLTDPQLAEDVTQETFLRVYRKLGTFAFRSKFSTWLLQIARNAGLDAIRSRERRLRLVEAVPTPPAARDPGADVEVQAAVDSLTPKLREALLLVELFGFTYREAGAVLGVPEGTVKSRVHLARTKLHAWLSAEELADEM